jgi:hypothetical protein
MHGVEITDLDDAVGGTPMFQGSSVVGQGDTIEGVSDVASAENARGDLAAAWLVSIPQQVLLPVRPGGGRCAAAQAVDPGLSSQVARLSLAIDGLGDTTVVAPGSGSSSPAPDVYYEPVGGSLAPISVPGGAYSAVASNESGATALAG